MTPSSTTFERMKFLRTGETRCPYHECDGGGFYREGERDEDDRPLGPRLECRCSKEEKVKILISAIAPRFRWASLEALEPCSDQRVVRTSTASQARVISALRSHPDRSFALFGPSGVGKTTYVSALYRKAAETGEDLEAIWFHGFADLARHFRDVECGRYDLNDETSYFDRDKAEQAIEKGMKVRLFLDELDKTAATEFARNALHEITDVFYASSGADVEPQLVVTSNLSRKEFIARWGAAIYRRLESTCTILDYQDVK